VQDKDDGVAQVDYKVTLTTKSDGMNTGFMEEAKFKVDTADGRWKYVEGDIKVFANMGEEDEEDTE